jgi:hypothetical protein
VVTVKIAGTILTFTISSPVKLAHDSGDSRLRSLVVRADIADEHRQGLGRNQGRPGAAPGRIVLCSPVTYLFSAWPILMLGRRGSAWIAVV